MIHTFKTPNTDRWFEDYPEGAVFELGTITVTEDEIIDFARQWDAQDMHVDRKLAAEGPFGGIIASGWHTIGLLMKLFVDHYLPKNGLASPGIDEVRWVRPVRPGDVLAARVTVLEARRSRSKPDRGMVIGQAELRNQAGELVLTMKPLNLVRTRPV